MTFLRIILIAVAIFLVLKYLKAILSPARRSTGVEGKPRRENKSVDRERIQDATFKDLPEDES